MQPLEIPKVFNEETPPVEILPDLKNTTLYMKKDNTIIGTATGTATVEVVPPFSYEKFEIPENIFLLDDLHIVTTNVPIKEVYPIFENILGCSHLAISIIGHT